MNNFKVIFLSILSFWACSTDTASQEGNQRTITLSGTVGFPQEGLIVLEKFENNTTVPYDTITLNDDYTFKKEIVVPHAGYYRLNFYNKQAVPLILDQDNVVVNVDGNDQRGYFEVKGSRDHQFIKDVQEMAQGFQSSEEVRAINEEFMAANQAKDQEAMDSLRDEYLQLNQKLQNEIIVKIDSIGPSLGVVEILNSGNFFDKDENFKLYINYAELLKKEMPKSEIARQFVEDVEKMKKLAIGEVAPDIALPNPDGEVVKLSSLRGKYVLVDFWAKWCKPCRMENPNVVRMYKKYNNKGFEVYGVSLDRKREDWLQAIEEDGLHWTQVSDLKYWNSEAAKLYNITAIPFALLLDPEGKIIGKNLRGKALENKLEEIFSN